MKLNKTGIQKFLIIVSYICITLSYAMAALTKKPAAYELSLYDNYSLLFWILTILASISSVSVLIINTTNNDDGIIWPSLATVGVILINVLIVSLPLFLGYAASNRTDVLNHVGYVRDIQLTGKLSPLDFYPAMHLLQYFVEISTGLTAGQSIIIVNVIFIVLWTLGPMMIVALLAKDKRAAYIAAAFTGPFWLLYYQIYVLPSVLSLFLLPVILAVHIRRSYETGSLAVSFVLIEIIIALFLVYLHPSTTLFFIAMLLSFELFSRLRIKKGPSIKSSIGYLGIALIVTIVFFTWVLSFSSFAQQLLHVIQWLMGENDSSSAMGDVVGVLQIAQLPVANLIQIVFNAFATPIFLIGLTCLLILIFYISARRRAWQIPATHLGFLGTFLAMTVMTIALFFVSSAERNPIRILRLLVILGMIISSWWLWEMIYSSRRSLWGILAPRKQGLYKWALVIFLSIFLIVGRFNTYENPRNGLPNQRVTFSELNGMKWLLTHRVANTMTAAILPDYTTRFDDYFAGMQGVRNNWPQWWYQDIWLPSGFYETGWQCMNQIVPGTNTYLVLSVNGKIASLRFPAEIRNRAHVYTDIDWARLDLDQSVNKIYDNGAFEIWITNGNLVNCGDAK